MSTVVMAVDGTTRPLDVLPLCRSMVREPDRVILVHVQCAPQDARRAGTDRNPPDERSADVLRTLGQALQTCGPVGVTTLVREGARADEVLKVANEERADLIIVGFGRARGLLKLFTGCDVADVERRASVPVIVARRSTGIPSTSQTRKGRESYAA